LKHLASVGVAEMDEEHDEVANAINNLISTRSPRALQEVLEAVHGHFKHEETLLSQHLYQSCSEDGALPGFDATLSQKRSHFQDHRRILDALEAAAASVDSDGEIPCNVIMSIKDDFENHTARYDSSYAHSLPDAMKNAESALGKRKAGSEL